MRRFVIPPPPAGESVITLTGDAYRHLITVLRLKPGTIIALATPSGDTYRATITAVQPGTVTLHLGPPETGPARSPLTIVLYQGLPKGDKLELIIQKVTELGVARIVPFPATRSVTRIPTERLPERLSRWQRIASEAARQSGAPVPTIDFAPSLAEALTTCDSEMRLLPWEDEQTCRLHHLTTATPPPASVALLIGPEGGLPPTEVELAHSHGFRSLSLGPRILRTETAGLALVAMLQQVWGDMG